MKRNMDLIRKLLLQVEQSDGMHDLSGYSEAQLVNHTALLIEAGLIEGGVVKDNVGHPVATSVIRLTWRGCDFLDAARSDTAWNKPVTIIKEKGGAFTFDLLNECLKLIVRSQLGIPPT